MRTVALLARKGGTGKTTLAVHLAVLAAESGRRVLLVDTDPQRSAGDWWRVRKTDDPQLVECAAKRVPAVLEAAKRDGIDLAVWTHGRASKPTPRTSPGCRTWC